MYSEIYEKINVVEGKQIEVGYAQFNKKNKQNAEHDKHFNPRNSYIKNKYNKKFCSFHKYN